MILDTITTIFGHIINALVVIGAATKVLVIMIPLFLVAVFWILVGNYREELSFRRFRFSRIGEIDELDPQKYFFLMKAFLGWMGFNEEIPLPAEDEEDEKTKEDDNFWEKKDKKNDNKKKKPGMEEPLILVKEGIRYGVLLERKKFGVGRFAFNKLEKAMGERDCQEGIIFNNGFFSKEDLEEGRARNIRMWDRDWFIKELLEMQGFEDTAGKDFKYYFQDFWRWALRG